MPVEEHRAPVAVAHSDRPGQGRLVRRMPAHGPSRLPAAYPGRAGVDRQCAVDRKYLQVIAVLWSRRRARSHVRLGSAANIRTEGRSGGSRSHARVQARPRDVEHRPMQDGGAADDAVGVLHDDGGTDLVPVGPAVQRRPGNLLPWYWVFSNGMSPRFWKAGDVTVSFPPA